MELGNVYEKIGELSDALEPWINSQDYRVQLGVNALLRARTQFGFYASYEAAVLAGFESAPCRGQV